MRDTDDQRMSVASPRAMRVELAHPTPAKVYDALRGGMLNWGIDQHFVERAMEMMPSARVTAGAHREFVHAYLQLSPATQELAGDPASSCVLGGVAWKNRARRRGVRQPNRTSDGADSPGHDVSRRSASWGGAR